MWSYLQSSLAPAAAGARSLHILEESRFGKADHFVAGDDQVIEHANVDQREALA